MDLELNGKVAIVGGASKGLGRACSEVLAEEGVRVAMCARTASDLERTADEIRDATGAEIFTFAGDLDKEETIAELVAGTVERFGQLDIMVNNSGGPPQAFAVDSTEEQWQVSANRSLFFFARMTREALPHPAGTGRRTHHQYPGQHGLYADTEPGTFGGDADGRHRVYEEPVRRHRAREHTHQQRVPRQHHVGADDGKRRGSGADAKGFLLKTPWRSGPNRRQ